VRTVEDLLLLALASGKLPGDDEATLAPTLACAQDHLVLPALLSCFGDGHPAKARQMADSALVKAEADRRMLRFEVNRLDRIFAGSGIRIVLLKGAGYVLQDFPFAFGRRVSDIDILVSEEDLEAVEKRLRAAGYVTHMHAVSDYDQDYYRKHMHELPPLMHSKRRTVIDVHHRLTPRTGRIQVAHRSMMADARPLPGTSCYVFTPSDQMIHACVHGLFDDSINTPIRTVLDIRGLWISLTREDRAALLPRARASGAERPVQIALDLLFRSDLIDVRPDGVRPTIMGFWIDQWVRKHRLSGLARLLLVMRGHWLRMPLYRLVPHLGYKAWLTVSGRNRSDAKET